MRQIYDNNIGSDIGSVPPGDKLLSETIMDSLQTHICVTPPQWIKYNYKIRWICHFAFT